MTRKNTLVILFALSLMGMFTTAFINGPANRGHDKTGSPVSSGTCLNCHASGSFSPSLQVAMFDGETEIDEYEPGKTYTLKYQLLNSGSPAGFGFQTVALDADNASAGTFSNIPDGMRVIELKEVNYLEHSSPRPLSSFEVNWTAPDQADDLITIYSAGVAANGNNNTGGDGADTDELVLMPATSSTDILASSEKQNVFALKGNMVKDHLNISGGNTNGPVDIRIFDQNGTLVDVKKLNYSAQSSIAIMVDELPDGWYVVQFNAFGKSSSERFIKI